MSPQGSEGENHQYKTRQAIDEMETSRKDEKDSQLGQVQEVEEGRMRQQLDC